MDLGIALWGVVFVVFESVEIFVAFSTGTAAVRLVLFHAEGAGVRIEGFGVDDGEGAVFVCVEFLRVMSVLCVGQQMSWIVWVQGHGIGAERALERRKVRLTAL